VGDPSGRNKSAHGERDKESGARAPVEPEGAVVPKIQPTNTSDAGAGPAEPVLPGAVRTQRQRQVQVHPGAVSVAELRAAGQDARRAEEHKGDRAELVRQQGAGALPGLAHQGPQVPGPGARAGQKHPRQDRRHSR